MTGPCPEIEFRAQPTPDFVDLLESTEYGTDGLRYRTSGMCKALTRLGDHARCVELRDDGNLVGTYLLVERDATAVDGPIRGVYRTCLSVSPEHAGRGLGRQLTSAVRDAYLDRSDGRVVLYGTIDATNARSMKLAERTGYSSIAALTAVTFTRLIPYRSPNVESLSGDERAGLIEALRTSMGHHSLFDAESSVICDEVLTYRKGGRIVACVQLVPKQVQVTSLGGKAGDLFVRFARMIPGLRRLVGPTVVLQAATIWAEDEHRSSLIPLFEDALVRYRSQAMVMLLDEREPIHAWLMGKMRLGWLQACTIVPESVRIMAGFAGVTPDERETIAGRPFWVSALDLE